MTKGREFRRKAIGFLGLLLFACGILLGMALAGGAVAADIEARFYGFEKFADKSLPGLRCPVLMTASETGTIAATFKNPTDKPLQLTVLADISNRILIRSVNTPLVFRSEDKGGDVLQESL